MLICVLLVIVFFFLPMMAWMYIDIRQMEIRVEKATQKIEGK